MLFVAAILLFLVGVMHSVLGEYRLIRPLLSRADFPSLLGSQKNARLTLWIGWHALTLFWWAQAVVLAAIAYDAKFAQPVTLAALGGASAAIGLIALVASKGKHLSWLFFLPLAVILGWQLWSNTGM